MMKAELKLMEGQGFLLYMEWAYVVVYIIEWLSILKIILELPQ